MKGYKKERGAGRWRLCVYIGRDPDTGKERRKWKTVCGSERVAQRELNKMLAAAQEGKLAPASHLSVLNFLDRWLEQYAKVAVAASTLRRYQQLVHFTIGPVLGSRSLDSVRAPHVQAAYAQLLEKGHRKGHGLSARSVLHVHRMLHIAFKTAVRWGILAFNPIDAVTPPRVQPSEPTVPAEADVVKLLAQIRGTRIAMPIMLAAYAGLRRGEILALTWDDIDFDRGGLTVRRALERVKGADRPKDPKTRRSRRFIPLPKTALKALDDLKADQERHARALGDAYVPGNRVCVHQDGRPWTLDGLSSSYRKIASRASFPAKLHELRHAHATWLLRKGVHPRIVAERLGHSATSLTMDTYSHVLPGMQDAAVKQLDRVLRKAAVDNPLPEPLKRKKAGPRTSRKPASHKDFSSADGQA